MLAEHRGHRLGMLLKVANLQELAHYAPEAPLVFTFNAEENRHMLNVNEAVGFRAVGYDGAWKKTAPPRSQDCGPGACPERSVRSALLVVPPHTHVVG